MVLAGELEVDGDLKVTGTVDANGNPITNVGAPQTLTDAVNAGILASALSDDGLYEYSLIYLSLNNVSDSYINNESYNYFRKINDTDGIGTSYGFSDFHNYLTELLNDGWILDRVTGDTHTWWIFKRPISND